MFYTIISKIPIISASNPDKKFLKIFILGSVLYILLHYYLYSADRIDLLNKLRGKLYYVMLADLGIAYVLSKYFSKYHEEDENHSDDTYTNDQTDNMIKDFQEMRRLQMLQHQELHKPQGTQSQVQAASQSEESRKNKYDKSSNSDKRESPFVKHNEPNRNNDLPNKQQNKQSEIVNQQVETDTLPVFMGADDDDN